MIDPAARLRPPGGDASTRHLKDATGLCPRCLAKVPGRVFERDGAVWLRKTCPEHGDDEALLASDARLYWTDGGARTVPGVAAPTGCCASNHSCTMIFEITERCNLTCPTCFTASSPHRTWQMPFAEFTEKLDKLLARGKSDSDMIQLSGGEPTLHPDIERMVEAALVRGLRKVYVNTNGIRLAREPELARRLAELDGARGRVQFYLQFDGFDPRTYASIRGADHLLAVKRAAVENASAAGLFVLPVMTVTRGVNEHEVGALVRMVVEHHPRLNTIMLQPAFYGGRYENERRADRLTLAGVAHLVAEQTGGMFAAEDFGPIPCSHPNCFALAVGLVRDGRVIPISRYFPKFESWGEPGVAGLIERLSDRMPQHMLDVLAEDRALDALLDLLAGDGGEEAIDWADHRNFVLVGIKPFMDAHTYDQDRVDRCCVHVIDRAGEPVSLCEYNALRRPRGLL